MGNKIAKNVTRNKIAKNVTYVVLALGIITFFMGVIGENYNLMIIYAYILGVISVAGIVSSTVHGLIKNKKALKSVSIVLLVFGVLILLGYILSDDSLTIKQNTDGITNTESKWVGVQIYMLYSLVILTILSVLFSVIAPKFINK